ncbi:NADPH-dependent FMN reductase [Pedobacter heparinus]|uniref:NAD(P)H dehydrogenase (Quinone) n=1 Tax=Pedobacter heparinus (strain ATCC 13125 / DSM 2366 / CIP 104194 / JCM 7457 / NBRC 12017 / NCIMB 9290 / NRRL B-14731 / HIM 762-3) TaxID=485917 RepID=C6Y2V6_PEDHD|nr:NAD(P)H-dependent oxidoreductase [Pedobacter heparinus]ACU03169.1 NAD(P)H dehydrogenase (quinone) [Pedobacter heparinus DSM 2366]
MSIKIAAFSGSLRKDSYTTKLIKAFKHLSPDGVTVEIIDISQLPLLNQDLEADLPTAVRDLHQSIENADAIILATPEYNRSYSPVLKNALDWGSRPQGQNKWDKKPAVVLGCTPYNLGAFGAVQHLRQVLVYLNMQPVQQPEFYLAGAADKFDGQGNLIDEQTKKLITDLWNKFMDLINK